MTTQQHPDPYELQCALDTVTFNSMLQFNTYRKQIRTSMLNYFRKMLVSYGKLNDQQKTNDQPERYVLHCFEALITAMETDEAFNSDTEMLHDALLWVEALMAEMNRPSLTNKILRLVKIW